MERFRKKDGKQAAQHDKFTLSEINDLGDIVDDVVADGHQGINQTNGEPAKNILQNLHA